MTSLCESQAFLDQFDKCLPLCEKGDAVTVINALHTLNSITQASISQAMELSEDRDFVCSFLLELELALELYISPTRKLGTQDGGLPALYSFGESEVAALARVPSRSTKSKVRKFLEALGVAPSPQFEQRSVADTVAEFLSCQVKPNNAKSAPKPRRFASISWADQCSSGSDSDSDCGSLPNLEDEDEIDARKASPAPSVASVEEYEVEEEEEEEAYEEDEDVAETSFNAAALFLSPAPFHGHTDMDQVHEVANTPHYRNYCDLPKRVPATAQRSTKQEPYYKTMLCSFHLNGMCKFGDQCNFAHGEADLRDADTALLALSTAASAAASTTTARPAGKGKEDAQAQKKPYKTRMCQNWLDAGHCKFGSRCMFAHGDAELKAYRKLSQQENAAQGKKKNNSDRNSEADAKL